MVKRNLLITVVLLSLIFLLASLVNIKSEENQLLVAGSIIFLSGILGIETGISTSIIELIMGSVMSLTSLSLAASADIFKIFSDIGAIILMFIAGTEIDVKILWKNFKTSMFIGILVFFIPFISVFLSLTLMYKDLVKIALIATSSATTSVAIVYMFLKEFNILNTDHGQTIFAGVMVTDILSMISLSLVLGEISIISLLYPLIILVIIALPKLLKKIINLKALWELELKFILFFLILLAFVSEMLGIHSAITSFLTGLVLAETIKSHEILEHKIKGLGFSLFIPILFFRAGLLMNFSDLGLIILPFLLIATIAIATKYLGSLIALKHFLKIKNHKFPFILNARLTIGTIAAIYGLEYKIINTAEYSLLIGIVIISSILLALITKKLPSSVLEEFS